jgi:hypothetical protein
MWLLLQKIDNVSEKLKEKDTLLAQAEIQARGKTEELRAKDILLARAEDSSKQPPAPSQENHLSPNIRYHLPPSSPPPTMYEDEDVYMGDNEADELRGERRKAMRKRKGKEKAWQVEDENEVMENSDTSESEEEVEQVENEGIDGCENGSDDGALNENIDINIDMNDEVLEAGTEAVRVYIKPDPNCC